MQQYYSQVVCISKYVVSIQQVCTELSSHCMFLASSPLFEPHMAVKIHPQQHKFKIYCRGFAETKKAFFFLSFACSTCPAFHPIYCMYTYISITSNIWQWLRQYLVDSTNICKLLCVLVDWWTLFIVVAQSCTFLEINTYLQTSWKSYAN